MRANRYIARTIIAGVVGVLVATSVTHPQEPDTSADGDACAEFRLTASWLRNLMDTTLSADEREELARERARAEALEIFGPPPDRDEPRFWIADGTFRQEAFDEAEQEHSRRVDAYIHRMTDFGGARAQPPGYNTLVSAGATPEEAVEVLISLGPQPDRILDSDAHRRWDQALRENAALFSGENYIGEIDLGEETKSDGPADWVEVIDLPAGCRPWEDYTVEIPPLINNLRDGVEN